MKRILEVQKQIGTLSKSAKNPFFKSAYLDLNDLLKHVTPLLHEQGLLLMQPIQEGKVVTVIVDATDGKALATSDMLIPPTLTDPQKLGSAITYFRRYTLKSLLAIAEGDDDGNLASKPSPDPTKDDILTLIGKAVSKEDLTKIKAWITHFDLGDIALTKVGTFKK